jgi:hypothetical protein
MDNAAGFDPSSGKVYSVAGFNGSANVATSYAYDPASQQWAQIADAPQALEAPSGAFVNGKMYILGGWDNNGNATATVYAYDPTGNSWSQVQPAHGTDRQRHRGAEWPVVRGRRVHHRELLAHLGRGVPVRPGQQRLDPARELPHAGGLRRLRGHRE